MLDLHREQTYLESKVKPKQPNPVLKIPFKWQTDQSLPSLIQPSQSVYHPTQSSVRSAKHITVSTLRMTAAIIAVGLLQEHRHLATVATGHVADPLDGHAGVCEVWLVTWLIAGNGKGKGQIRFDAAVLVRFGGGSLNLDFRVYGNREELLKVRRAIARFIAFQTYTHCITFVVNELRRHCQCPAFVNG